jgi:DNA-binding CsgD family transcriptional regulator
MASEITDTELRQLVMQGLSQREIARRTGLPRAGVRGHLRTAWPWAERLTQG